MSEDQNGELLEAINKVQWVLGESMFRTKKLKTLIANNKKTSCGFDRDLNELILALSQITNLYRHNIADRIKSLLQ
ncbi:MAG: hypothetical protein PVI66_11550 [Candidatus Aminicenantes bacterium]|jgi:hypothetical protein